MKKIVIAVFALAIAFSAAAQKKITTAVKPYYIKDRAVAIPSEKPVANQPPAGIPKIKKNPGALTPVFIGSSRNAFTLTTPEQTAVWYDKGLNTILGTFRGNNYGTVGLLATGNDINNFFSGDGGATWTGKTVLTRAGGTIFHRYPSGVFYNPSGNTTIGNAFTEVTGPRTDGTNWIATYHASAKYDLSDTSAIYTPTSAVYEFGAFGLSSSSNGIFNTTAPGYTSDYLSAHLWAHHGVWNTSTNKVDWGVTNIDLAPYVFPNPTDHTLTMYFGWSNESFSKDGSVGYFIIRGSDARPSLHPSYSPIIFKSTDGGVTWSELNYFDFGTLPQIQEHIFPVVSDPNTYLPYFDNMDIIVDGLGLPHIFASVRGCYSSNPDSLGYVYVSNVDGHVVDDNVFELYLDQASNWHAVWVDSIVTDNVDATVSPYLSSGGNVAWDHRIQASRTDDGSKVFVTWTDSDYKTWATDRYDLNPDLYIWGRDIYSYAQTPVKDLTAGDPNLWGVVYFHFTSPVTPDNAGTYNIPVTYADIATNGFNADLPVYHYFIQGVTLTDADFVTTGIQPAGTVGKANVTECYPNPFSGSTSFDVTLSQTAPVTVITTNVTGQTVYTKSYGTLSAGTHTLVINASSFPAGVYLNEIRVGDQKYTNKMIVK